MTASSQVWTPGTTPGAAPSGKKRLYINPAGDFKMIDDAGIEVDVGGSGGGSTSFIFASESTSMHSFNSVSSQYVEWDSTFRADSQFSHSDTSNAHEITANVAMEVLVSYQLEIRTNVANKVMVKGLIRHNNSYLGYTNTYGYLSSNIDHNSATIALPEAYVSLSAGDTLRLYMQIANGDTSFGDVANVYTNGGQITIKSI